MTDLIPTPALTPIPAGRGRWRIEIGQRSFANRAADVIGEIMDARSRRLVRGLNKPAQFNFTVDGHSPTARLLRELEHEVFVYRWSEITGRDEEYFRGTITQSQDILSEQRHTINYVAHDVLAVIRRRYFTSQRNWEYPQVTLVNLLLDSARSPTSSGGISFFPGSFLPYNQSHRNPDGTPYVGLGPNRVRSYPGQTSIGEAFENLAAVINGYDFDVVSTNQFGEQTVRVFYPYRGIEREDFALVYGSTVSSVSRSINSAFYANYARVVGQSDPDEPQLYAEGWTQDATDTISNPTGLWMLADSMADVTVQSTLAERVGSLLEQYSILRPAYSLGLTPGAYFGTTTEMGTPGFREQRGAFDVGDVLNLRIASGRLDVDTYVRVYGQTFVIGDDGEEDVEAEVGRPEPTFIGLFRTADQRLSALERR